MPVAVPTTVPFGTFSFTLLPESVTPLGASNTSVVAMLKVLFERFPAASAIVTVIHSNASIRSPAAACWRR